MITTPFVAAAIVTLYFDLRIRDEAFDVQMAMAATDRDHVAERGSRPPSIPTRRATAARDILVRPPVPDRPDTAAAAQTS